MSDAADNAVSTLDRCIAKLRWCIWMTVASIAMNVAIFILLCRMQAALPALLP